MPPLVAGETSPKPFGGKAYGSIPHLPGSRLGPGDHHCHEGQARICLEKTRDKHDVIIVQEKLDGSNVAIGRLNGSIIPLVRAGYRAESSPFDMHRKFADWVMRQQERWLAILEDGERLCGEWMIQAHGTRYALPHEPFVPFDLFVNGERVTQSILQAVAGRGDLTLPRLLAYGRDPFPMESAMAAIEESGHGALEPVEGAVWRVERNGKVDFLAKWVRPEKQDGCYLPPRGTTGGEVWNTWRDRA